MSEFLEVIPGAIPTKNLHQYLLGAVAPRPIAFASTISREGIANLAPFSFFNVFSAKPPVLIFSPARRVRDNTTKDTLTNVYDVPEVVVNIVSYSIVQQMNLASSEYPSGISEFAKAGLTPIASDLVAPFRVKESPIQMECKVIEIKPLSAEGGAGQLIFAEVLKMHIHQNILDGANMIDPHKADLVSRMGKMWYCRANGEALFEVNKPELLPGIGIDGLPAKIRNSAILTGNNLGMLGMIAEMPSQEAIDLFYEEEKEVMLSAVECEDDLHSAVKEVLESTGDIELAWRLLLCKKHLHLDEKP